MSATYAIIGSALLSAFSSRKSSTTTQKNVLFPTSTFLPEQGSIYDKALQTISQFSQEGLPDEVLERMLADIASGIGGARDAAGRSAALGFGPQSLSQSQLNLSQARLSAGQRANFAQADVGVKQANAAALADFFRAIQAIRGASPQVGTTTSPGAGAAAGALQGLSAGFGFADSIQGLQKPSGSTATTRGTGSGSGYGFPTSGGTIVS